MTRVKANLFVNEAKTDFKSIIINDPHGKKAIVRELFASDQLEHENTHAYDRQASFDKFYAAQGLHFDLIDIDQDGSPELIFQGFRELNADREYTEIYAKRKGKYTLIYGQAGYLMAYKTHPNTKELVLFLHQYPCCSSMSHNIFVLRLLEKRICEKSKYFLARSTDMKGHFFPDSCQFVSTYKRLTKNTMLYWSDAVISDSASLTSRTNQLIHYPKGAVYQELARRSGWSYILIRGTALSEKSTSVNAENISKMAVFAWIKSQ